MFSNFEYQLTDVGLTQASSVIEMGCWMRQGVGCWNYLHNNVLAF